MKLQRNLSPRFTTLLFVPIADVAAALLFFFLLSGTFLLQPGIAIDVPRSPFVLAPQRNPLVVAITSAPAPAIYFENRRVTPDQFSARLTGLPPDATIIVKADRAAPVDLLVAVSSAAISAGCAVVVATSEER